MASLQGSVVTRTMLDALTTSSSCEFPIGLLHMCQKLLTLLDSRQSYCNEKMVKFFCPSCRPVDGLLEQFLLRRHAECLVFTAVCGVD